MKSLKSKLGKTSLNICGGGSRGIIQLGMLKYWLETEQDFDMVIAGSVGSLNALLLLQGMYQEAEELWLKIQNKDVYTPRVASLWKLFTDDGSLNSTEPLEKLIRKYYDYEKIKALPKPFIVNVTNLSLMTAEAKDVRYLTKEEGIKWILASASPPILFPSVTWDSIQLVDCGLSSNYGLVQAVNENCDTVICLTPTNYQPKKIKNLIDIVQATISTASFGYLEREAKSIEKVNRVIDLANSTLDDQHDLKKVNLCIVRPEMPWDQGLIDFNYKEDRKDLIRYGYDVAERQLGKFLKSL